MVTKYWDIHVVLDEEEDEWGDKDELVIYDISRKKAKKYARKYAFYGYRTYITKGDGSTIRMIESIVMSTVNSILKEEGIEI